MSQDHYNALPEGHKLHEYTIKAVLGHGGFGITYLAWDENLNKDVAIKEYLPTEFAVRSGDATVGPRSSSDDEDYNWGLDRFVTEAQTLALFRHPSIVPVYRFFKAHGTAYMVMEYQEGESFSVLMRKHRGDLTEADLMGLVQPMLDGLAEVHRAGFLHRDVKPGNIFIRRDGSPVLLDFGAARSAVGRKSQNLTSIVTPGYAPLEQYFADGNQGPWTDIYSLAAILYQCVAGKLPPEAPARVKKDPITPISEIGAGKFSEHFLAAIDRALMVEEEERPQTTTEWRDMLLGRVAPFAGMATAADAEEADQTMVAGGFGAGATMLAGGAAAASAPSTPAGTVKPGSGQGSVGPAGGPIGGPAGGAAAASGPAPGGFATQAQARALAGGRSPGADSLSVGDPVTHTRSGRGGAAVKYIMIGFAAVFLIAFSAGAVYFVLGEDDALGIFTGKESQEAKRKAAEEKQRAEEAARKRAEDAALKAAEEKRRKEEAARKAEEDRKARAREEAQRTEEGRKRLEAEARKKRLAEEAARRAAEEKKRKEEEARRRSAEETRRQAEARRKQEAEDARRRAEEARLREEEAARRAEEEKRKQLASRTDGVSCPMSLSGLNGHYKNAIDCFYVRKIFQSALNSGTQGTTSSWRNSRTGNRGSLTVIATIRMANDTFCRRFRQTLVASGKSYSATGVACLIGQRWQIRN